MRWVLVSAGALVAVVGVVAAAFAGDTAAKVPGMGGAEIRWNELRYRKDLVEQLRPGLTWRLGQGGATRIELTGMALVGERGVLFPGEATFNLRFWSWEKWELVAFEENEWQWSEERRQLGLFPVDVWKEKDAKKAAEKLALALRSSPGKDLASRPAGAVTPGPGEKPSVRMPPPVEHTKEALAEIDRAPWLQLEMRFGDLIGLASFEAAKSGEAKGEARAGGEDPYATKSPARLRFLRYPSIRAKTELAEGSVEVVVGVLRIESKTAPSEWLVSVTGGEAPELWRRRLGKDEEMKPLPGKRVEAKSDRKETAATIKGNVLTLQFHGLDYVFEL